jgi:acyl-CoA thioesterase FadM
VAGFVTTYRSVVAPWQCDALGHMNVQHYFAAVGDGMFNIQTRLGLGGRAMSERMLSFAVVHAETDFMAELVPGDAYRLESAIAGMTEKMGLFLHRLMREEDGKLAMRTHFHCLMMNLEKRRSVPVPGDIREAAEAYLVDPAEAGFTT